MVYTNKDKDSSRGSDSKQEPHLLRLWGKCENLDGQRDRVQEQTFQESCQGTVTSTVFESKDEPTQMTKQSFTIIYFITYKKTIHFKLICKHVHSCRQYFSNTWIQFSNPKLN